MDDLDTRIAHIESMRAVIGDAAADAAIAALRAEAAPPTTRQSMDASEGGSVAGAGQASAGGDLRDNALGSGNLVLHDIQIAPGGALIVGDRPADLPPRPEELRRALASYLATLLERYRFLSLQGFGTGGAQQMRVELNAVFINVWTNITIGEAAGLFAEDTSTARRTSLRRPAGQLPPLSDDLRQWLDELLLEEERILLLGAEPKGRARRRTAETADREHEQQLDRIRQRLLSPRTALELIRHHRALVLLGDPGSGKTTVLRHLAMSFALERLRADAQTETTLDAKLAWSGWLPLPILIQLRRFATELSAAPADAGPLLAHVERALAGDRHAALARHLLARLEDGTVLLMCDGLDEVADDTRRAWVAQAVALFQSRFPHSRLVLTSRTYAYRAPCQLPQPFQVATLQPLDPAAQDDFIARWYRAALLLGSGLTAEEQAPAAEQQARDLVAALERRQRLREIAANPLLLMMIALVHQRRLRLPQQRARLYEECLLLLLEQWEQQRAEGSPAGLATILGVHEQTDRLALIQPIAYQLQMLGREEARQDEVRDWLMRRFLSLARNDGALAETLIEKFLTFLEGRSGLLIARDIKDRYAFPHKTFQEYLAARELIYRGSQPLHEQVLAQRHAPTWREVILLIAGHLVASGQPQEAKALGWKLLKADPPGTPEFYRSAVLAGEIVEELGEVLEDDGAYLKQDVVGRLVALIQGGHLIARERVEAAFLLGRLGDPRLLAPEQPAYWCEIAPGPFWYGDDRKEELRQVELPHGYKIARYTVTNAEYRRFVEAGGYAERRWWTVEGWKYLLPGGFRFPDEDERITLPRFWHDSRYNQPIQPVVGVTWYEAAAYCAWLTAQGHTAGWLPGDAEIRLPTWLEWERAARHTDQRRYPWGDAQPDVERTNYRETGIGRPAPVGCFLAGAAACGALDMVGNTIEWTATEYQAPEVLAPRKDFTTVEGCVMAWNDFSDEKEQLCCGARGMGSPYVGGDFLGFRVMWFLALIV